jgi:death-on-curing protein
LLNEPFWVSPAGVILLNREVLNEGERHILRDMGLLESACDKPRNIWTYEGQDDAAVLATSLCFGIARNHPFEQGNKRTAFAAMVGFLAANGFRLNLLDDRACSQSILAVLTGTETEDSFAESLRRVIERDDPFDWK